MIYGSIPMGAIIAIAVVVLVLVIIIALVAWYINS